MNNKILIILIVIFLIGTNIANPINMNQEDPHGAMLLAKCTDEFFQCYNSAVNSGKIGLDFHFEYAPCFARYLMCASGCVVNKE